MSVATPTHVLVVDDDEAVRDVVRRGMTREGWRVTEAERGSDALAAAANDRPDVVVLDLHLPDVSGLEVLEQLRQRDPTIHVIMLTGAGNERDRVVGLVRGADDYVVKPFSVRELAARVLATERRRRATEPPETIVRGALTIDVAAREARIGETTISLTRREFDLLAHLVEHQGQTFSREELLSRVWGSSAEWQTPATITEHIRRLRLKLDAEPAAAGRIVTVRGVGYRYEAPTEAQPEVQPETPWTAPSTDDAVVVLSGSRIVHVSPAARDLVGADEDSELVGQDVLRFVAPRSMSAAIDRLGAMAENRAPRPELVSMRRLDGTDATVEVHSAPATWNGEQVSVIMLWDTSTDTSRVRELAMGLRTDVADAVIIGDTRLQILSANAAAEELYGWREADVLGRDMAEVVPWADAQAGPRLTRDEFRWGDRWHGDVRHHRRDGSEVLVSSSVTLLRDEGGTPVGVVAVNRPALQARRGAARGASSSLPRNEVAAAIDRGEFVVHYQPVVDLAAGRWHGVEALVRWQHPDQGLLTPAEFIGAAEASGAIVDLGAFVVGEACRQWARWEQAGHDLQVAVNLSGPELGDRALPDRVAAAMEEHGVPAGRLWLEVTETSLVEDLEVARDVVHAACDAGARIAIDDFGTGWASLTYLQRFPVHSLKIDRAFVHGLATSSTDAAIVTSILRLAAELDLTAVAEGIESPGQRAQLLDMGCTTGQGYLLGAPVPPEAIRPIGD